MVFGLVHKARRPLAGAIQTAADTAAAWNLKLRHSGALVFRKDERPLAVSVGVLAPPRGDGVIARHF